MPITLNKPQRKKLLELCVQYFPETYMHVCKFSGGYKDHAVEFVKIDYTYSKWLHDNDGIPRSPYMVLGFKQHDTANGIEYEQTIEIHWYELCMTELPNRMYTDSYQQKMTELYKSSEHIVDFLYNDYIEDFNLNIIDDE